MKILFIISILLNFFALFMLFIAASRVGGIGYLWKKFKGEGVYTPYDQYISLHSAMGNLNNKIVFLGDSMTEFCDWSELLNKPNIVNRGIPGDETIGVRNRVEDIVRRNPESILLMIGINDLMNGKSDSDIIKNYKEIFRFFKTDPNCKIYIKSILPINKKYSEAYKLQNERIRILNSEIENLRHEYGFTYINLYPEFLNASGYLREEFTTDGLHLNGDGYLLWKNILDKLAKKPI